MTSPPFLQLDSLSVTYAGGHRAAKNISFSLQRGERVGLVGESGSGKSTLARAILGLIPPSSGTLQIQGHEFHGTDRRSRLERARLVQMVFQDPYHSLNPRRTIRQALVEALGVSENCREKSECDAEAEALLRKVHLDRSALNRFPHQFSGGQRQRICIARALAPNPQLLVCDEAVSALDVTTQRSVVRLLRELSEQEEIALLFITHDIPLIEHLCDRVIVLDQGELVEEGTVHSVFHQPQAAKTQQLLNSVLRI
jgi:peptide/nickel transport system ATP-binding protein